MTFDHENSASEWRFDYVLEWDIENLTHNVTGRGVDGPDSKIYLRLHTSGERRIGILLAGRSRCDTKHMKTTFGFRTIAETKVPITLSDGGVVGPQAPC